MSRLKAIIVVAFADLLVAVGLVFGVLAMTSRSGAGPFVNPNPASSLKLVAMGDSYISGEGARRFFDGTDAPGTNECRRAPTAYPYLVARRLKASLTFTACSGATTEDILRKGQQPVENADVPGGEAQIKLLRQQDNVSVILLSIGGNDASFGDIGRGCAVGGDCRANAEFWLKNLDRHVYRLLVRTYREVKKGGAGADVFVLNYPNPLASTHCLYLPLSSAEQKFLTEEFMPRLNQLISFAATVAQVRLIDVEHAFDGKRICDQGISPGEAAANVLGVGRTWGQTVDIKHEAHGSFHPNELGHRLLARIVEDILRLWQRGALPELPQPPPSGITPPPHVPSAIGAPVGPYVFPSGTDCDGKEVTSVVPIAGPANVDRVPVRIVDAKPRSTVCYRAFVGAWHSTHASDAGQLSLALKTKRVGIGGSNEVLYDSREGGWVKIVITPVSAVVRLQSGRNLGWYLVVAGSVVGLVLLVFLADWALFRWLTS
jgi:lysophospholipase L1-like esterase